MTARSCVHCLRVAPLLDRVTGGGAHASLLLRHGESVEVVQARLGHASAAEARDTYSHLWPDSEGRTRLAVDSALADLSLADRHR